jgi:hypothetical protein
MYWYKCNTGLQYKYEVVTTAYIFINISSSEELHQNNYINEPLPLLFKCVYN